MSWDSIVKQILEYLLPIISKWLMDLIDKYLGRSSVQSYEVKQHYLSFLREFYKATKSEKIEKVYNDVNVKANKAYLKDKKK